MTFARKKYVNIVLTPPPSPLPQYYIIFRPEPVFVNVYGAKELIPPAYVAWRADTTNKVVVPARQGWESIPVLHKRFTNMGSETSC
jgi:hypothetical protein